MLLIHCSPYYSTMHTKIKSDFSFIHCFPNIDHFTLLQDSNVVPRRNVIILYCILHMPTVDCGELLWYFPQLDKQEAWINYPTHVNSNTVDTAGERC